MDLEGLRQLGAGKEPEGGIAAGGGSSGVGVVGVLIFNKSVKMEQNL